MEPGVKETKLWKYRMKQEDDTDKRFVIFTLKSPENSLSGTGSLSEDLYFLQMAKLLKKAHNSLLQEMMDKLPK